MDDVDASIEQPAREALLRRGDLIAPVASPVDGRDDDVPCSLHLPDPLHDPRRRGLRQVGQDVDPGRSFVAAQLEGIPLDSSPNPKTTSRPFPETSTTAGARASARRVAGSRGPQSGPRAAFPASPGARRGRNPARGCSPGRTRRFPAAVRQPDVVRVHPVVDLLLRPVPVTAGDAGFQVDDARVRRDAGELVERRRPRCTRSRTGRGTGPFAASASSHVLAGVLDGRLVDAGVARVREGLVDAPPGHDVPAQEDGQPPGLPVGGLLHDRHDGASGVPGVRVNVG